MIRNLIEISVLSFAFEQQNYSRDKLWQKMWNKCHKVIIKVKVPPIYPGLRIKIVKSTEEHNFKTKNVFFFGTRKFLVNVRRRLVIGHSNINSLRNKLDQVKLLVRGKIDILVFVKTKLAWSFPNNRGILENILMWWKKSGGEIFINVREVISNNHLTEHKLPNDIETSFLEMNPRITKWWLSGLYRTSSHSKEHYLKNIGHTEDFFAQNITLSCFLVMSNWKR